MVEIQKMEFDDRSGLRLHNPVQIIGRLIVVDFIFHKQVLVVVVVVSVAATVAAAPAVYVVLPLHVNGSNHPLC
ncbi:hypothetical protein Ccrd_006247 [Cynara cardunculus var. scolymus]|uniref:Uncharacterized protein n=1 Tax=Cynara cardunculus var. scolymus TaxID=59895 RepID=A0A103XJF3_CYNCS|nr:hypothetical protein Ccrd_006247 [Cynara cardunculus var. scolymus]